LSAGPAETTLAEHRNAFPFRKRTRDIMKITFITPGSRGDVQPYVALGRGLRQAGHAVCILASPDFKDLITAHGLQFADLGGSIESVARGMENLLERGNFLAILSSMGPSAERMVLRAAESGMAACRESDLLIAGLGGLFLGIAFSEKYGIPIVPAYMYPFTPAREFSGVLAPAPLMRLPGWANRLSHILAQQMLWQTFHAADNKARRAVLHIPPAPWAGPFAFLQHGNGTILNGYSRLVIPLPSDWSDSVHVTGYWPLEPSAGWVPPADLQRFLDSGPPPVYIGFGSMVNRKPEEAAQLVR
jgi:sterol 3beta-glucosyltransferase